MNRNNSRQNTPFDRHCLFRCIHTEKRYRGRSLFKLHVVDSNVLLDNVYSKCITCLTSVLQMLFHVLLINANLVSCCSCIEANLRVQMTKSHFRGMVIEKNVNEGNLSTKKTLLHAYSKKEALFSNPLPSYREIGLVVTNAWLMNSIDTHKIDFVNQLYCNELWDNWLYNACRLIVWISIKTIVPWNTVGQTDDFHIFTHLWVLDNVSKMAVRIGL